MSYDVEIASKRQPRLSQLGGQFLALNGVIEVRYSSAQVELVVQCSTPEPLPVFIDEPEPSDPEEFDEAILASCRSPKWRTTITAPLATGDAGIEVARAAAILVAKVSGGAAFDPQVDGVIWPERKWPSLRRTTNSPEKKIDLIELQWIAPLPKGTVVLSAVNPEHVEAGAALCSQFISAVSTFLPSCSLTNVHDGVRGKSFSANIDELWRTVAGRHYGGLIQFDGEWPCFGGSIQPAVGDPSYRNRDSILDCIVFTLTVEASMFETGPLSVELRTGFSAIAHELNAIFGAAYQLRNWIWKKKQLWAGAETESRTIFARRGWWGVPPEDQAWMWLHRFYASHICGELPPHRGTSNGLAIFSDAGGWGAARLVPSAILPDEFLITRGRMLAAGDKGPVEGAKTIPLFDTLQAFRRA